MPPLPSCRGARGLLRPRRAASFREHSSSPSSRGRRSPSRGGPTGSGTVDRNGKRARAYAGRAISAADDFVVLEGDDERIRAGAAFLGALKAEDPALVTRLSDVALTDRGLVVTDRVARVRLLFAPDAAEPGRIVAAAASWRAALALLPQLTRLSLASGEADLRFDGRIVLKAPRSPRGAGRPEKNVHAEELTVSREPRHRIREGLRADRGTPAGGRVDILGKGTAVHKGARKGAIIDVPATVDAIKRATEEAEIMAGAQIERAVVGVAGPSVKSSTAGRSSPSRRRTGDLAGRHPELARRGALGPDPHGVRGLHVLPRDFVGDGQEGVADPLGMVGSRLEADVHVVTIPRPPSRTC